MRKTEFAVGFTKQPFTFFLFAAFIYLGMTIVAMGVLQCLSGAPTAVSHRAVGA
jgi:putative lysine/arginine/ornithine/histidine/octopine transport system permease protein